MSFPPPSDWERFVSIYLRGCRGGLADRSQLSAPDFNSGSGGKKTKNRKWSLLLVIIPPPSGL